MVTIDKIFDDVDAFIKTLALPEAVARGIIRTAQDAKDFYLEFYKRNTYLADDLLDFRESKIENSNITLDIFLKSCYNDMKKAFEDTFLQQFTSSEIARVQEAINTEHVTLEQLFMDFKKNPNKNILKNII
jgi:hypothetical protein